MGTPGTSRGNFYGSTLFDETPPQNAQYITNHDGFHTNPFTIVVPTGDEAKVKVMISFPPWTAPSPPADP